MQAGYKQFCPVAMAAEILCNRWTMVLLRELIAGSTRFNDLRRGLPRMSPALLSQRLKELTAAGILEMRGLPGEANRTEYHLTEAGRDLKSVVEALGIWGQRWIDSDLSLDNLDATLLMWDMRRNVNPDPLPKRRSVVAFVYEDVPAPQSRWWLIVDPSREVDLCSIDPGFEIDLLVSGRLRAMTAIWMGLSTLKSEVDARNLSLDGEPDLARNMHKWLRLSPFAVVPKLPSARVLSSPTQASIPARSA
jgi:DNA-binding HxlR family transcriptional regulator